ncbi:MAG: S8 family serine peptidase, partial [Eubacteriales bacterium]|nr:S8 family serine peptidase [Eubacteriales bacterium]
MRRKRKWMALLLCAAISVSSVPVLGAEQFETGEAAVELGERGEAGESDPGEVDTDNTETGTWDSGIFDDSSTSEEEFGDEAQAEEGELFGDGTGAVPAKGNNAGRGTLKARGSSTNLTYVEGEAIVWMKDNGGLLQGSLPYETETLLENMTPVGEDSGEELYRNSGADEDTNGSVLLVKNPGQSTQELIGDLLEYPSVELAEPNYIVSLESLEAPFEDEGDTFGGDVFTDGGETDIEAEGGSEVSFSGEDTLFSDSNTEGSADIDYSTYLDMSRGEWNKNNQGQMSGTAGADTNTEAVWEKYGGGSSDVVVAIVDSGIAYSHPDLAENVWTDGLKYDELTALEGGFFGINCVSSGNYSSADPYDDNSHGTHCAGIVAASNDGEGVTGIAPNVKVMAVKVLNAKGEGMVSDIIKGFSYVLTAAKAGVNVRAANYSMGGAYYTPIFTKIYDALGKEGVVTCVASGNSSLNLDNHIFDSSSGIISPYVVVVDALEPSGKSVYFSNYGKQYTHVYAPGVSVLSTVPEEKAAFLAEYAKGNLLYTGFEDTGNPGTDTAAAGPEINFYQVQEGNSRLMGLEVTPQEGESALGSKSVSVSSASPEIISAPIHLDQAPPKDSYLSFAGKCVNAYGFPTVSLVDRNGREYILESAEGPDAGFYVDYNIWDNVQMLIPQEFNSWDDFQIKINVTDYFQEDADFTCHIDCLGIGTQKVPYDYMSGTSMATPAVTGEAALLASIYPNEGADYIAASIRGGVNRAEEIQELCLDGGYINIEKAVENPYPVITGVEDLGDTFLLNGYFQGENISVTVGGLQTEIVDSCENYLEIRTPQDMKEGKVEIRVTADNGTGRYYWILGEPEEGYDSLLISMGDKLKEEFDQGTWVDMEGAGDSLYLMAFPEFLEPGNYRNLWKYQISKGTWEKLPAIFEGEYYTYDICAYDGEFLASGVVESNGITVSFVARLNEKSGKWKSTLMAELPFFGSLFTYQGRLYYGGGVHGSEELDTVYRIYPETGRGMLTEMKLPIPVSGPRLEERGKGLLFYGQSMNSVRALYHYNGTEWSELSVPEDVEDQTYQFSAQAVEDGFLLTGLVRDAAEDKSFTDTWLLRDREGEFSFEPYPAVFCPVRGQGYVGKALGNTLYELAYIPQKGSAVLKKLDGIKAYGQTAPEKYGWVTKSGKKYYYEDGKLVTGLKKIDGVTYYFFEGSNTAAASATQKGECDVKSRNELLTVSYPIH